MKKILKKKISQKKNNESIQKNDIKQNIKQNQIEEIERKYNEIMQKIRDGTIIYSDSNLKEENERERKNINGETVFTCKVRNCDYESVFNSSFCFKHKSAIL